MQSRIELLADELIRDFRRRRSFDLIEDFALQIPLAVISDLLGIPSAARPAFRRHVRFALENQGRLPTFALIPSAVWITRFLRSEIRKRHVEPTDDLIGALVQARENEDRLTDDELVSMIFILLVAGYETTANLIGSGALALLQHPEQLDMLRANPSLMKAAIEELVRFTSPLELPTERFAARDVTIHGVTIARGEMVFPVLASANRDEQAFSNPDQLILNREDNRHVGFGFGVHFCIGAPLARLEAGIALTAFANVAPQLRLALAPGKLRWRKGYQVRGLTGLPLSFCQGC